MEYLDKYWSNILNLKHDSFNVSLEGGGGGLTCKKVMEMGGGGKGGLKVFVRKGEVRQSGGSLSRNVGVAMLD